MFNDKYPGKNAAKDKCGSIVFICLSFTDGTLQHRLLTLNPLSVFVLLYFGVALWMQNAM